MTKEQFVRRIRLIQNFEKKRTLSMEGIGGLLGEYYVKDSTEDRLISEMIHMMNESLEIKNSDLLYWWLWEEGEKQMYYKGQDISVNTPEKLYEFIVAKKAQYFI